MTWHDGKLDEVLRDVHDTFAVADVLRSAAGDLGRLTEAAEAWDVPPTVGTSTYAADLQETAARLEQAAETDWKIAVREAGAQHDAAGGAAALLMVQAALLHEARARQFPDGDPQFPEGMDRDLLDRFRNARFPFPKPDARTHTAARTHAEAVREGALNEPDRLEELFRVVRRHSRATTGAARAFLAQVQARASERPHLDVLTALTAGTPLEMPPKLHLQVETMKAALRVARTPRRRQATASLGDAALDEVLRTAQATFVVAVLVGRAGGELSALRRGAGTHQQSDSMRRRSVRMTRTDFEMRDAAMGIWNGGVRGLRPADGNHTAYRAGRLVKSFLDRASFPEPTAGVVKAARAHLEAVRAGRDDEVVLARALGDALAEQAGADAVVVRDALVAQLGAGGRTTYLAAVSGHAAEQAARSDARTPSGIGKRGKVLARRHLAAHAAGVHGSETPRWTPPGLRKAMT